MSSGNIFHLYVNGPAIEGGSQQVSFGRDEVDDLVAVKQTLQSELCFVDPCRSTIATITYRNKEGQMMPVEGSSTFTGAGLRSPSNRSQQYLSSASANAIQQSAANGDYSMTVYVTTEENPLAGKDAVVFEAIARLALEELFGGSASSLTTINGLIQDARCAAAENPTQSIVDILKSASFLRLQSGLSKELTRRSSNSAPAATGSIAPTITATALATQIVGSALPALYRQSAQQKRPTADGNGNTTAATPARGNAAGASSAGSALQAVRGSSSTYAAAADSEPYYGHTAASINAATPTPPSRNKSAAPSRNKSAYSAVSSPAAAADDEYNAAPNFNSAATAAINSSYKSAAANIAAARRGSNNVTPTPAADDEAALGGTQSYSDFNNNRQYDRKPSASAAAANTKVSSTPPPQQQQQAAAAPTVLRQNSSYNNYSSVQTTMSNNNGGGAAPSSSFTTRDQITIYCVYSGATSQRAKAIQVSRAQPSFDVLMQTLKYKFGTDLVLGYIDPTTGECSEVLDNEELKTLIRHCDQSDSLTLQCWATHSVKFDADIIDTDFERQMAAADFSESQMYQSQRNDEDDAPANATRNKSARPTSAARQRGSANDYNTSSSAAPYTSSGFNVDSHPLAERPAVWDEYRASSRAGNRDAGLNASSANNYDTRALLNRSNGNTYGNSGYGQQQQQQRAGSAILDQSASRGNSTMSRSVPVASSPRQQQQQQQQQRLTSSALSQYSQQQQQGGSSPARNKSARPTSARNNNNGGGGNTSRAMSVASRPRSRYGGAASVASKPAFTPSHKLDVSGTAWNEDQLRELFDTFDKDNNGYLDREEMMDYFYTYHDDMGIVDAKNKFVKMLDDVPEFQDGKLTFDEFAIIMLRIAQW